MFKKTNNGQKVDRKIAIQGSTYSLIATVVVLAILIVVNVMVSALPTKLTQFDISSSQLYSITSNTKVVVNALEDDVTIYWIVQDDEEDEIIENLLQKYEDLSDHITVEKKNPDVYPTFAEQYTDDSTVDNNSLVVECGDKYRFIAYDDIYLTDVDYTTYSQTYSFDGEGQITSAINYVTSDVLPKIYVLEGHGEGELGETFTSQLTKANYETESLSLLTMDSVPEDASAVIINAPSSDISEEEFAMLATYVANGGKLMVMSGPVKDTTLTNLNMLLETYDVEVAEGVVCEANGDNYVSQMPYLLLPEIESDDITQSLIDNNYYIMMPISEGLVVSDDSSVTTLLTTTSDSYSKVAGYDMTTYDKEDDDIDGPFALAVSITNSNDGQLIWVGSSYLTDETYNAYSSGANDEFAMNAISTLIGETDNVQIRSKSLNYNYLTISDSQGSKLKSVMIGIIPAIFVVLGIYVVAERKRKKNE